MGRISVNTDKLESMADLRKSGAYQIFVSRHRKSLQESRIESPEGLPCIFLNIKTFMGT